MLAAEAALDRLAWRLSQVLASFGIPSMPMGRPEHVEKASKEAARLFQGYAKSTPSKATAYAAALSMVRNETLDDWQRHLVAAALCESIMEQGGVRAIGHPALTDLLEGYEVEAASRNLWEMTWFALMSSYFAFDPRRASVQDKEGWRALRDTLARTVEPVLQRIGTQYSPDWAKVLRRHPELLTEAATDGFAKDYLAGEDATVKMLAEDLAIPASSWFWQRLVLSAVRVACKRADANFRKTLPRLVALLEGQSGFRNEALTEILTRFHTCQDKAVDAHLCDFVVRKDVWKNPKLKVAGIATAWNQVSVPVWQMALQWVNKRLLRDFFDILAARNRADEGRLAFWSQYMEQISWTRLMFGPETLALARSQKAVGKLIADEEGLYATLTVEKLVDAFMMEIGGFIIIEFSKKPNACYVYPSKTLSFDRHRRTYEGGTADLKYGRYKSNVQFNIIHREGWQVGAQANLAKLGIFPDAHKRSSKLGLPHVEPMSPVSAVEVRNLQTGEESSSGLRRNAGAKSAPTWTPTFLHSSAPRGASFAMEDLHELLQKCSDARIDDRRSSVGGRLWIEDPMQHKVLSTALEAYGFAWAPKRSAWYFPESS